MTSAVTTVLVVLMGTVGASLSHELSHYVAARLLGVHVRFDVGDWAEHFEATPGERWRAHAVYAAPVVLGLLLAGVVATGVVALPTTWVVGLLPAWWLLTAHGAVFGDDFRFQAARPAPQ